MSVEEDVEAILARLEADGHDGAAQYLRALVRLVGAGEALRIMSR